MFAKYPKLRRVAFFVPVVVFVLLAGCPELNTYGYLFVAEVHAQAELDQPMPCAGLKITVSEQFGNRAPIAGFSVLQSDDDVIIGDILDGERTLCVPPGETSVEVMGKEQTLTAVENVVKTVHFNIEVNLPNENWVEPIYAGQSGTTDPSYKFIFDQAVLSTNGWECRISPTTNNEDGIYVGSCDRHFATATYISLAPGNQEVTITVTHRETGTKVVIKKQLSVPWRQANYLPIALR